MLWVSVVHRHLYNIYICVYIYAHEGERDTAHTEGVTVRDCVSEVLTDKSVAKDRYWTPQLL